MLRSDDLSRQGLEPGPKLAAPCALLQMCAVTRPPSEWVQRIFQVSKSPGRYRVMQSIEDAQVSLTRGMQDLEHVRHAAVRLGHTFQAVPDLTPLGYEIVVGIDHQQRGNLLFKFHFCHAPSRAMRHLESTSRFF